MPVLDVARCPFAAQILPSDIFTFAEDDVPCRQQNKDCVLVQLRQGTGLRSVGMERLSTVHMAGILLQAGAAITDGPASNRMVPESFLCQFIVMSVGFSPLHLIAISFSITYFFNTYAALLILVNISY